MWRTKTTNPEQPQHMSAKDRAGLWDRRIPETVGEDSQVGIVSTYTLVETEMETL